MTFVKSQNIKLTIEILKIGIRAQLKVGNPWTYVSDGLLCMYRKGLRGGMYVIDKSIDAGVTWESIRVINPEEETIIMSIDGGVTGYRQQVRTCALRIDQELTPLGFFGAENTDWEEIIYIG
jgi:hypothetical protein